MESIVLAVVLAIAVLFIGIAIGIIVGAHYTKGRPCEIGALERNQAYYRLAPALPCMKGMVTQVRKANSRCEEPIVSVLWKDELPPKFEVIGYNQKTDVKDLSIE